MIEQDYLAYKDEIVAYLYKFVGDEAEDIVQTAFLELLAKDSVVDARALLFKIAKRRAQDYLRNRQAEAVDPVNLESVACIEDFDSEELTTAMLRLSDEEVSLIRMVYWEGLNQIEISKKLGCSHVAIRHKVSRAVKKLHKLLGHNHNSWHKT